MKKISKILLIILFPLGIIFCIGKNLFSNKDFSSFLGGIFIFGCGALLAIWLARPDLITPYIQWIKVAVSKIASKIHS